MSNEKLNALNKIYKSILRYSGLDADDDGYINIVLNGSATPAVSKEKRLVLPTEEQMKDVRGKLIFHPLNENVMKDPSEIINILLHDINIKLNFAISSIAHGLINLHASPENHKLLTPDQSMLLKEVRGIDKTSISNFETLIKAAAKDGMENGFVSIYLKRNGYYKDKKYFRVGITSFNAYKDLKAGKYKIRVKDREAFIQLFKFMFPDIDSDDAYDYPCNADVAPNLVTILNTSVKIACRLNDLVNEYKEFISGAELLTFDAEWLDAFNNLNEIKPLQYVVPAQEYGTVKEEELGKAQDMVNTKPPIKQAEVPPPQVAPSALTQTVPQGHVPPPPPPVYGYQQAAPQGYLQQQPPTQPRQENARDVLNRWSMSRQQGVYPQSMNPYQPPMYQQPVYPQQGYPNHGYLQQPMYPQQGYQQPVYPQQGYPQPGYPNQGYNR